MKNKLMIFAISLWIVTISAFAFFFVRGFTTKSTDQRSQVELSNSERDLVLGEMRSMLASVNGIFRTLSVKDMPGAANAARSSGMTMAVDVNPVLMAKLPLEFKELGIGTHKAFDELAADIDKGATAEQVMARMAIITNRCLACHQSYRLGIGK